MHQIQSLIDRFCNQIESYQHSSYNETQTRNDFINPFFQGLGWDVNNQAGLTELYRHVIHEDTLKLGRVTKKPDYSFRIGGVRKFFVEAKKPAISLKNDREAAFQVRRYGWSAKLPLSIITNFKEFAVYDCRIKPVNTDSASTARLWYLTYIDYLAQWPQLMEKFSFEAVWQGKLDNYITAQKLVKGTLEVDAAFLAEIERWREVLARHIAVENPQLTQRQLNFVVQQTIDRIIFLRICEDRGIEDYGRLLTVTNGSQVYPRLFKLFREADERYNSGLFHFKAEKERDEPDELTPTLRIADDILRDLIKNLYYPESPYEFSVLPTDILGQIYEQFLGKVIRVASDRTVEVEEKPEVKKAGGVYYTPTYIVDYIVKQTLTPLLAGKKAGPRGSASQLRIVDPACGSGSFLLGAYQFLLNWHLEQYLQEPERWVKGKNPCLYQAIGGTWRLTIEERKRILRQMIFGVDIDPQAVEVTKLSLLVKVLEDEQSVIVQLSLFRERVLPDLDNNIKCGNSLIGSDFYQNQQLSLLDEETRYRVNAFDWEREFTDKFDAVIGNPPYIRIQTLKEWAPLEVEFYKDQYITASKGNYDIYLIFVENFINLLNDNGYLGFILPHKFFNADYGEFLRNLLAEGKYVVEIVHFGDQQIFTNATTYTCLLFLSKQEQDYFRFVKVPDLFAWKNLKEMNGTNISSDKLKSKEWHFAVGIVAKLLDRLNDIEIKLENVTSRIFQGIKTSADKIYIVEERERKADLVKVFSREKNSEYWLESNLLHPLIKGGDSKRFFLSLTKRLILFPYMPKDRIHNELIPESVFKEKYPLTLSYLFDNKEYLENREKSKMCGPKWYAYGRSQALDVMSLPKIFTPDIAIRSSFSFDETGEVFFTGGVAGGYGILTLPEYSPKYVLGLLNSQLLEWFIHQVSTQMRGGYYSYESRFIRHLPIRTIDFNNPTDRSCHDQIVHYVEQMLELNRQLALAQDPPHKKLLTRQIEAVDREIDRLVYKLYDLTAEEIEIVEKDI